ncbi:class I SAM-dependent DNA methyltransferase [Lutimaribacter marinistellae]|uniref:site-specific DNA-methyltransferase (adenine-specific) n=1 Tax=Lutimaribacter marinistellae TaxID=1820329 RepID=A0ABV7TJL6_9RHOB
MNAVEIEEAISALAEQPFDAEEFPFAFLEAFGNKPATIKRLRAGASNKSDQGGVLQTNNIHLKVCGAGEVTTTLAQLKASPSTAKAKAKFVLATDGTDLEAEDLTTGETIACAYGDFPDHFGFFLPLAGISTVKQIRESAFDIKATGRLNRLYVELLKDNPEWGTAARRHDMNHFMARLIFCFFAEDTDIFTEADQFTGTIERMSEKDSSNTHEVISMLFKAMNTKTADRGGAGIPRWANVFPYVNGGLFSGGTDVPRFSKIARSYLLHIGNLDWTKINPDIFGSMIQAVADDEERGALGMHYTSVPNILKVLNPLFLDDLREKLDEAGGNPRKLLNLRNRMAKIRVFDPACGSGNFLVIAYKEMRAIEAQINERRGEAERRTEIPLTNFRGIELRDFPAEIARLALIIAEYQCDVTYRGQKEALAEFLPLDAMNWITCGNALRLDWLGICPPTGTGVKHHSDDLFMSPVDQAEIDFENEGGETYICGNPPYIGSRGQELAQKADLEALFGKYGSNWKNLDYVAGWLYKAAEFSRLVDTSFAFVTTNSICQGQQVASLWPIVLGDNLEIFFSHRSFKWANNAAHNAGVICIIVGIRAKSGGVKSIFDGDIVKSVSRINPYLVEGPDRYVDRLSKPCCGQAVMGRGNHLTDGGHLILTPAEAAGLRENFPEAKELIRRLTGAQEFIRGVDRFCLVINDDKLDAAKRIPEVRRRIDAVRSSRLESTKKNTREVLSQTPHRFEHSTGVDADRVIMIPTVSSERRDWLPVSFERDAVVNAPNFALYDAEIWNFAILSSRCHLHWIASVCGRLKTDFRYSNTMGWNTFPVAKLTEKNKEDLTRCAEGILLARESHFPATIADLYDPEKMPADLRAAHDRNDETLERIYIGRRFRNDTERLEKLFELYTRMTKKGAA